MSYEKLIIITVISCNEDCPITWPHSRNQSTTGNNHFGNKNHDQLLCLLLYDFLGLFEH